MAGPARALTSRVLRWSAIAIVMTWRSRRLREAVGETAARQGAVLVSLFREATDDPFVHRPELNAADGLHPSDAGYRVWFGELTAQASLPQRLSAALDPDR